MTIRFDPVIVKKEIDDAHYYWVDGEFYPSVTKILHDAMPMPIGLKMWLGEVGNEKAEYKLNQAAARGSLLHAACERLLEGGMVDLENEFPNKADKKAIVGFKQWAADYQPEIIAIEKVVASTLKYAGTLDILCKIGGKTYVVDIKTSASVYPEHLLQVTAYRMALTEMTGIEYVNRAILHLNKTKRGYTFVDDEKFVINGKPIIIDDFMCVYNMYKMLNGGVIPEPPQTDVYPKTITLYEDAKN